MLSRATFAVNLEKRNRAFYPISGKVHFTASRTIFQDFLKSESQGTVN